MAAVIRLKRRVDEDPLDAFVLNCKRQRTTDPAGGQGGQDATTEAATSSASTGGETSTVLKFAGTFPKAESIPTALQQRLSKDEAREAISRVHRPRITSRNREASRQSAQNSRFRIVNCTRSISQVEGESTTIVDVERDIIAAAAAATVSAASIGAEGSDKRPPPAEEHTPDEPGYVYDLYVVDDSQPQVHQHIPFIPPDNLDDISVAIYDDPLFSSHRALGDRSDSGEDESEDSNDENNWRNDYPDEDEDVFGDCHSVDEDDMRRAVEELDVDGDRELSSDDEDVDFGGDREDGNAGFAYPMHDDDDDDDGENYYGDDDEYHDADEQLNQNDVDRFGTAYARYKARIMKQMAKQDRGVDTDESDSEPESSNYRSSSGSESENFDLYD